MKRVKPRIAAFIMTWIIRDVRRIPRAEIIRYARFRDRDSLVKVHSWEVSEGVSYLVRCSRDDLISPLAGGCVVAGKGLRSKGRIWKDQV